MPTGALVLRPNAPTLIRDSLSLSLVQFQPGYNCQQNSFQLVQMTWFKVWIFSHERSCLCFCDFGNDKLKILFPVPWQKIPADTWLEEHSLRKVSLLCCTPFTDVLERIVWTARWHECGPTTLEPIPIEDTLHSWLEIHFRRPKWLQRKSNNSWSTSIKGGRIVEG